MTVGPKLSLLSFAGGATDYMKKEVKEGRTFDLMFLDADKSEYKDYLDVSFAVFILFIFMNSLVFAK